MRNQNIAKVLKEYRKRNHLSVNDVSILLEDRSFTAAPKTIYGWESGQANPSADILLTLCDLYNITDILEAFGYDSNENFHVTPSERTIIEAYRAHPEMHEAVSVLLGCSRTTQRFCICPQYCNKRSFTSKAAFFRNEYYSSS